MWLGSGLTYDRQHALLNHGPGTLGIWADKSFGLYKSGVYVPGQAAATADASVEAHEEGLHQVSVTRALTTLWA